MSVNPLLLRAKVAVVIGRAVAEAFVELGADVAVDAFLAAAGERFDQVDVLFSNALPVRGEPRHVADVAAFRASDLSAFVTGATVPVDGGNHP